LKPQRHAEGSAVLRAAALASLMAVMLLAGVGRTSAQTPAPVTSGQPVAAAPVLIESALEGVPPDTERMESYSHGRYALSIFASLWSIAVLAIIVASGLGSGLERWFERFTRRPNLLVALYATGLTLLTWLASLPLTAYTGFMREKAYGFANQSFGAWLGDQGKELLVGLLLQALFVVILFVAIRRLGRLWWVAGSALGIAFLVLVLMIGPVFIAPLFNKFVPLRDADLRDRILKMAHQQGIPADEVFEVDASRQSEHGNAYVAGLLGTQRIVIYDTLLKRFTPRELEFVMGHEMGHYVLRHIWKAVAFLSVVLLAGFYLVDRVSRRVIASKPGLGIAGLARPASLPLIFLVFEVFTLLTTPAINTFNRTLERQADTFGLEATQDPLAAASAFIKFGRDDLGEYHVNPWVEKLLYSHPSLGSRIEGAQSYAQSTGQRAGGSGAAVGSGPGPETQR